VDVDAPAAADGAGRGSGASGVSGGAFFWNALLFTRALRAAGLTTDLGAAIDYSRALTLIDIGEREQVRAAGMALFARRRDEVPIYDEVFARFWQRYELALDAVDWPADLAPGLGPMARPPRAPSQPMRPPHRRPGATSSGCSTSPSGA